MMTRKATQPGELLTIPETAERLRVQRTTVYRLISAGALRAVNVAVYGKARLRIREDDLAAFIDARTASTDAPSMEDALAASQ